MRRDVLVDADKALTDVWVWERMRRRHLLSTIGVASSIAGCVGRLSETDPDGTETQTPTGTGTSNKQGCSVPESSPLPSTDVPSELTRESAISTAELLEEQYAIERARAEDWNVDGTDKTEPVVQSSEDGFFVKVSVAVLANKPTQVGTGTEQTLYGDFSYTGWYRITAQRIERAPGTGGTTPPEDGWKTLACE